MPNRTLWALVLTALLSLPLARTYAADHAAPTTSTTAAHPPEELMPSPTKATTIASALWVVVIFLIVLAILYPTAWKNILAGLKAREQRIRSDIAEAEAARAKAEVTLREYNAQLATAEGRVRDLIAGATADGERIAAQIRARGEQEAQEAKERATREIDAARKQAIADIYDQAATLATGIAEKILRRTLNPDDQRDLVNRSLDQVKNLNN